MEWFLAIAVTLTVILACVAASRGRENHRLKINLKAARFDFGQAVENYNKLKTQADTYIEVASSRGDELQSQVDCLAGDRDRLAEENSGLKKSYLAIHNGLVQNLGQLVPMGYKNKHGQLTKSKFWARLKALGEI